jgi:Cupin-like domain
VTKSKSIGAMSTNTPTRGLAKFFVTFVAFLLVVSLCVMKRLEDIDDDDIIASSTQIKNIRARLHAHHHLHHDNHKSKEREQNQHHQTVESFARQIAKFGDYLEESRKERKTTSKYSPKEVFEQTHPPANMYRWKKAVAELRTRAAIPTKSQPVYDIHNCPMDPPQHYPYHWNLIHVINNWNPNDTRLPGQILQGLCVFDWGRDEAKARNYREKELPFVVENFPTTMLAAERWNSPGYLEQLMGDYRAKNYHSTTNHFESAEKVNDIVTMTYPEWSEHAVSIMETSAVEDQSKEEHWYFRVRARLQEDFRTSFLYEELPCFDPSKGTSFAMVDPNHHRGIDCHFGMKGSIADSHYDPHSNFIALLGGKKRLVLS